MRSVMAMEVFEGEGRTYRFVLGDRDDGLATDCWTSNRRRIVVQNFARGFFALLPKIGGRSRGVLNIEVGGAIENEWNKVYPLLIKSPQPLVTLMLISSHRPSVAVGVRRSYEIESYC